MTEEILKYIDALAAFADYDMDDDDEITEENSTHIRR